MDWYVTRLTWNSNKWQKPSGVAYQFEHGTYVANNRFGNEEWLNWNQLVFKGWQYAFLQGVNRSLDRLEGKTINVRLFTISPQMKRFYVGYIRNAEVLSKNEAGKAVTFFRHKGLIKTMGKDIRAVGGASTTLMGHLPDPELIFNIRFKPKNLKIYDSPVAAEKRDYIWKLTRYMLCRVKKRLKKEWADRTKRRGTDKFKPIGKHKRSGTVQGEAILVENEMQKEIFTALTNQYGKRNVTMEEDFADIKVRVKKRYVLIEIKNETPRLAIRKGLGQLLEYAYRDSRQRKGPELMIVAPDKIVGKDKDYLDRLNKYFRLGIQYRQYVLGSYIFSL